jgi:hypothetical protein
MWRRLALLPNGVVLIQRLEPSVKSDGGLLNTVLRVRRTQKIKACVRALLNDGSSRSAISKGAGPRFTNIFGIGLRSYMRLSGVLVQMFWITDLEQSTQIKKTGL